MTAAKPSPLARESDLLEGWAVAALEMLAAPRKGKKPIKALEEKWPGSIPYLDIEAFDRGHIRRHADAESSVLVDEGSVLVVWDGARCGLVGKAPVHGALGSTIMELKLRELNADYIRYFLETLYETINCNHRGTGIPHVDPDLFWNLEVPIAPLAEQKRIVEKMEQLLARVNAARERLARVLAILKRFRQAVLAAACSGRLSADWREQHPEVEPASKLLLSIEKFRSERAEKGRQARRVRSVPAEFDDEQDETVRGELPDSWAWCRVDQIATVSLGGTPSRKTHSYWNGDVAWVSSGEVANCRIITTRERITREGLTDSNAKVHARGTVLIAMIGEGKTRGQAAILDIDACTNQNVAGLVFDAGRIVSDFVWLWALSQYERNRAVGRGGAQPALNGEKVRALTLPLPPFDEQGQIVRRVEALFKLAGAIERRVAAARARAEKLAQAILAKAFRGELVPTEAELARRDGRSYEPASGLLARIRSAQDVEPRVAGSVSDESVRPHRTKHVGRMRK